MLQPEIGTYWYSGENINGIENDLGVQKIDMVLRDESIMEFGVSEPGWILVSNVAIVNQIA